MPSLVGRMQVVPFCLALAPGAVSLLWRPSCYPFPAWDFHKGKNRAMLDLEPNREW